MSLTDSATLTRALTIDVRSRRSERWLGVLALLAVAFAASLLALPVPQAALFFTAISSVVTAGLWWHGWLGDARRLTRVSWLSDGSWRLTDAGQANLSATLSRHCRVGSRWVWLRWHAGARQRSMLLVQGDVAAADLRRLCVRLRLESVSCQPTHPLSTGA